MGGGDEGRGDLLAGQFLGLGDALDGQRLGLADQADDEDGFEFELAAASGEEPT